jgi:hypothetical protein
MSPSQKLTTRTLTTKNTKITERDGTENQRILPQRSQRSQRSQRGTERKELEQSVAQEKMPEFSGFVSCEIPGQRFITSLLRNPFGFRPLPSLCSLRSLWLNPVPCCGWTRKSKIVITSGVVVAARVPGENGVQMGNRGIPANQSGGSFQNR